MKIELPDTLQAWLNQQALLHGHATLDAYVAECLTSMRREWQQRIEKELITSLDSGEPIEVTSEFWEELDRQTADRLQRRGKAAS